MTVNADRVTLLFLSVTLLTQAYIDLQVVYASINVPVADLMMVPLGLFSIWRMRSMWWHYLWNMARALVHSGEKWPSPPMMFPAGKAFSLFMLVGLLSLIFSPVVPHSAYFLLRKPLFCYLAYGVLLSGLIRRQNDAHFIMTVVLAFCGITAAIALLSTLSLWFLGYFTANLSVPHIVTNQKALAVALAPYLPMVWAITRSNHPWLLRRATISLVLMLAAILMTLSKNAWITAAFVVFALAPAPWASSRRLLEYPVITFGLVFVCIMSMMALPFISGSALMADAFDSRMSLNIRAWEMFSARPVTGFGPGLSTLYEVAAAPHYRINYVDDHGVIQKIAAETGLLGLFAYGAFCCQLIHYFYIRAIKYNADTWTLGLACSGLALHVNLLFSTEYFSSAHWVPLGIVLGCLWGRTTPLPLRSAP